MNWMKEVEKREAELIHNTQELLKIKSVLDEETTTTEAPFGNGIRKAFDMLLAKGTEDGFTVRDLDGYAGHIEWGQGDEILGILCHLDVVPEGAGWTSPPYAADIRDGKIYARGAIDDKGPTMAAYYALKIVKELGYDLTKRVRLIVGTDEESQWRCMAHYFKHEEMPVMGFAPDADFPIIYAEKGICDLEYTLNSTTIGTVEAFRSGERLNMVPEVATVVLRSVNYVEVETSFTQFIDDNKVRGELTKDGSKISLKIFGKSAHGMEPEKGINSGLLLGHYLHSKLSLSGKEEEYFSIISELFYKDSRGKRLGIAYEDKEKGDVTLNIGVLRYNENEGGKLGINLRYPKGADFTSIYNTLNDVLVKKNFLSKVITHEPPHAMNKDHILIQTLSKVYEEQTGEKAEPFAIGGGTYARSLKAGVAFGPLFPGQEDVAHQADEYISIAHLKKATAIYAQAIYELAK